MIPLASDFANISIQWWWAIYQDFESVLRADTARRWGKWLIRCDVIFVRFTNLLWLQELLERIGKTRFVLVEFARDGRSSGVAYASYENPDDNITAVNKFDGKKAANQIIDVELIKPLVIGGFNRSRERHNPRSRRPRPKKATAEDLDKELEQYMDNKPFPATTEWLLLCVWWKSL